MIPFSIVVAMDTDRGIGYKGQLPWRLPADLKHFKEITTKVSDSNKKNVVIMGRKTWESLPDQFKPLPKRINIVLTRNSNIKLPDGVLHAESLVNAFLLLKNKNIKDLYESVFVIGGQQVFDTAIKSSLCKKLYVTHILKKFSCDTFFPVFEDVFNKSKSSDVFFEDSFQYSFVEYTPKI